METEKVKYRKQKPKKPMTNLPIFKCQKSWCGHEWIPREDSPIECPACHSRSWWIPAD
jgi:hypothetical protein